MYHASCICTIKKYKNISLNILHTIHFIVPWKHYGSYAGNKLTRTSKCSGIPLHPILAHNLDKHTFGHSQ